MGNFIEMLGQQAATGGLGTIMGIATAGWNDQRQLRQQQELQRLQMQGNREMMDYSMKKQLEMWKATNYAEQIKQMKIAGLNPGLLYGMKGGGGVTTGSPTGAVQGANAPMGGGEIMGGIGMGINLELMKAQKSLIDAQTRNLDANTTKTEGVDTGLARTQIFEGMVRADNTRADTKVKELQADLMAFEKEIKGSTLEEAIQKFTAEAEAAKATVDLMANRLFIEKATANTMVDKAYADLVGTLLTNELTRAQTVTEGTKPGMITAETKAIGDRVHQEDLNRWQRWEQIFQDGVQKGAQQRDMISRIALDMQKMDNVPLEVAERVAEAIVLKGILGGPKGSTTTTTTPGGHKTTTETNYHR